MRQTKKIGSAVRSGGLRQLVAACGLPIGIAALAAPALAGPQGEHVIRGNVRFDRNGSTTTITASNRSIIRYSGFNIGGHETVRFVQPSARARVLNRIDSTLPTRIDGSLLANGRVYLVNPSGIFFGANAVINTGGIVAAAGHLADADFLRGVDRFTGLAGTVENQGHINARHVLLAGGSVLNSGVVTAPGGTVVFAAGDEVYVGERGGRIFARVNADPATPAASTGVQNTGTVNAEGGRLNMSASDMYGVSIRSAGLARARDIRLEGQGRGPAAEGRGVVEVTGTLDASQPRGCGGEVRVLGDKVALHGATLDASGARRGGTVLVGGGALGRGPERNATAVYVSDGSTLRADALARGDGGKVVVWSDVSTKYYGHSSARGAGRGGDGGFIETSSKNVLDMRGHADAGAASGKGGLWLLDPRNVTLSNAATSGGAFGGGNPDIFTPNADDAIVNVGAINAALDLGTSVTITTSDAVGTQPGHITQLANADILKSAGGDATLTLLAASDITLNGTITSTSGALHLVLTANDPGQAAQTGPTGTGGITIGDVITTLGGNFTASGVSLAVNATLALSTGAFSFTQNGVAAGAVSFAGGTATASSFNLTATNAGTTIDLRGLTLGGGTSLIDGGANTVEFRGANNLGSGDVTVRAAGIDFRNITGGTTAVTDLITGTGTLRLQPVNTGDAISLGDAVGGLRLDGFDLDALAGSGGLLQIGYDQVPGLGTVSIDNATFKRATQVFGNAVTVAAGGLLGNQVTEIFASGALAVNGNAQSSATLLLHSGRSGAGDLTFGNNVNVVGLTVRLRAGVLDGSGTTAAVDLSATGLKVSGDVGTFTATPTTFELRQDASIAALPANTLFGGSTIPVNYTARSDGGSVTVTARNQLENTSANITLFGVTGVTISPFLTADPLLVQSLQASAASGSISVEQQIRATAGLSFTGPVVAGFTSAPASNFELSAGTGTLTFSGTLTVRETGTFSLILEGDDLALGGDVARQGAVTARLVIRPATASRNVVLGASTAGTLALSTAEVAFLQDGFAQVTIGRADGTGSLTFAGATAWSDPVRFLLSSTDASAIMTVLSAFTTSGDALVELTANQVAIAAALNLGGFASRTLSIPNTSPVENITANWSLIVRGAQIGVTQDVTAARGVWLEGTGNTTTLSGTILTNNAPIVIADNVILASAVTLDSANGSNANVGGRIIVTGTVNSEAGEFNTLSLRGGQLGDVELRGALGNLGATQRVGNVDVLIGNRVMFGSTVATGGGGFVRVNNQGVLDIFGAMTLAGSFEQTAGAIGGTNLRANITTDNADITFRRAVDLLIGDITLSTGDSGGGDIIFDAAATIDSSDARGLTLTAGTGSVSVGANVGTLAGLSFFHVVGAGGVGTSGANNVTLGGQVNATTGAAIVNADGNIIANAGVRGDTLVSLHAGRDGTGDLTFAAALEVRSADVRLRAGDGTGGAAAATVAGIANATFAGAGAIGSGAAALDAFLLRQDASIVDAAIPLASQFTGGFNDPSPGGFNYTLTSDDGDVTVSTGAKVAGRFLSLNAATGTVTIAGAIAPNTLSINAAAATIGSSVTTTGAASITSANTQVNADLSAGTTLAFVGSIPTAAATIAANLTAGTGMSFDYTVATGSVTIQGDRTLRVDDGILDFMASPVTISSGTVVFEANDIDWTGEISPSGTASLVIRPVTTTNNIQLNSTAGNETTLALSLAQLQGIQDGFASLTFGGNYLTGVLTVFGADASDIMFHDQTIFLMGGAGGRVAFRATGDVGGGGRTIRGDGNASFIADVGANGQILLSADLVTAGGLVQFQDVVAVAGASSITTSGGDIVFLDTIDSETDTPQNLTLDAGSGLVDLQGAVGSTGNLLRNLVASGARINLRAVSTSEDQTYTTTGDGVFVFGNLIGRNLAFATGGSGAVVIEEAGLTIRGEGSIDFGGALRSADGENNSLDVRGTNLVFNGAVGAGAGKFGAFRVLPADSLVGATATLNTGVFNAQSILFDVNVLLGVDAEDLVADDSIEFRKRINSAGESGGYRLRVSSALVVFLGDIGTSTALTGLEVVAVPDATVQLNLARIVTTGDITFGPAVDIMGAGGSDPVQLRIESGNGNVSFINDVRSFEDVGANRVATGLRIDHGSGAVRFFARVGTDQAFGTDTGPALVLSGSGLTRFDGSINLASHMTADGPVRFGNTASVAGTTRSEFRGDLEVAGDATRLFFSGGVLLGDGNEDTFTVGRDVVVSTSGTGEVTVMARTVGPSSLTIGEAGFLPSVVRLQNHVGLTTGGAESRLSSLVVRGGRIEIGAAAGDPLSIRTSSGGVEFAGPVALVQDLAIDSDGMGRVTFAGTVDSADVGALRRLSVDVEDESIVVNGSIGATVALSELSLTTPDADGRAINLNGAVVRAAAQSYNGRTVLGSNVTMSGNAVAFARTLRGDADGTRSLTINPLTLGTARVVSFGGVVGGGSLRLSSLSVHMPTGAAGTRISTLSGGGTTTIAADVLTSAGASFGDAVRVSGSDVTIDSGGGALWFLSTLDSATAGVGALRLRSSLLPGINPGASIISGGLLGISPGADGRAAFRFGGNVGVNAAFQSLEIGAATADPLAASVVFTNNWDSGGRIIRAGLNPDSTTFRVVADGTLSFGAGHRVLAIGNLILEGGSRVVMGDVVAVSDLVVRAPVAEIRLRDTIPIASRELKFTFDRTTSLVAGRRLDFRSVGAVETSGAGDRPVFASRLASQNRLGTGENSPGSALSTFVIRDAEGFFGDDSIRLNALIVDALALPNAQDFLLQIDLPAEGISNTRPFDAGALPQLAEVRQVTLPAAVLDDQTRADLQNLALSIRDLSLDEMVRFLIGRSFYDDAEARGTSQFQIVTKDRVNLDAAKSALETWYELVGAKGPDDAQPKRDASGGVVQNYDGVRLALEIAWENYTATETGTPAGAGLVRYLTEKRQREELGGDELEALRAVVRLYNLSVDLAATNLSTFEVTHTMNAVVSRCVPQGTMTREHLLEAVRAAPASMQGEPTGVRGE